MSQAPTPSYPHAPQPTTGGQSPQAVEKTAEHVRVLSILTWIYTALQGIGVLLGLFYVVLGLVFIANPPGQATSQPGTPPPEFVGWLFFGIGLLTVLLAGALMILSMLAARDLMNHRRRVFCIVMACFHCLNLPLGTVLGIFTIVVLSKPEARVLFERETT